MAAIVLLVAGTLSLVYGGFSYTQETHKVDLGPIDIKVNEKKRVNVPVWAGIGCIVVGGGLLLTQKK